MVLLDETLELGQIFLQLYRAEVKPEDLKKVISQYENFYINFPENLD